MEDKWDILKESLKSDIEIYENIVKKEENKHLRQVFSERLDTLKKTLQHMEEIEKTN